MSVDDNDLILSRLRGAPIQQCSKLEAMMNPTNPNRYEQNDNQTQPVLSSVAECGAQDDATRSAPTLRKPEQL